MNLRERHIVITGASGGIGMALTRALANKGARLTLTVRPGEDGSRLLADAQASRGQARILECELLAEEAPELLAAQAGEAEGGIDVLINLAGIMSFRPFQEETVENIERLWRVNTIVPMRLCRAVLPGMLARRAGRIVIVGSAFGSIGFPYFSVYSASKFALRGFSEALRRELRGTGVGVTYVAPRYTRTPLNRGAVARMAEALRMNMDEPERVAAAIVRAIEEEREERFIGFPENFFARLNALAPRIVDWGLRRQAERMRDYAYGKK